MDDRKTLAEGVRAAAELLESLAADRALLRTVCEADRLRLLQAAGRLSRPGAEVRRQVVKAARRQRNADRVRHEESDLAARGIRQLRKHAVYVTPNAIPPARFEPEDGDGEPELREVLEPQQCYVCKGHYSTLHHFYDQLCPPCGDFNFAKRAESADLSGRVALLTGGRVKIGYQAGIPSLRRSSHRHHPLPARLGTALCNRGRFRRVGPSARDCRAGPPPHTERRGVLSATTGGTKPARLHHQQRLPNGTPSAGFLSPHDGG